MKDKVLIAMATHCTPENGRKELLGRTLINLVQTVDLEYHELYVVDNSPEGFLDDVWDNYKGLFTVIPMGQNVGTAAAINAAWALKSDNQPVIKMDDDVEIHVEDWVEEMLEALRRDPKIGILGLKRMDLGESPHLPIGHWLRSEIRMLPHQPGQKWIIVEDVNHVMGTCQMYNPALIDKIGGLYQMGGLYGFDDSLAAIRCKIAGFKNCFLPCIGIDHIDPGGTQYQAWKENYAGQKMDEYNRVKDEFLSGKRDINFPLW